MEAVGTWTVDSGCWVKARQHPDGNRSVVGSALAAPIYAFPNPDPLADKCQEGTPCADASRKARGGQMIAHCED